MTARRARAAVSTLATLLLPAILAASPKTPSAKTPAPTTPAPQGWKWPEKIQNRKIFPEDFPPAKLAAVMKGFTRSLGVRCSHCHVGEEGQPLEAYDFVSDKNPNKDRAREMYRMLGDINDHLKKITPSGDKRVNMWCDTCHAGRARPMTLAEELGEAYRRAGIGASLARYRELRESSFGAGGYDFRERSLAGFGQDLTEKGDHEGAIAILRLNTEQFPRSGKAWEWLADGCVAGGKKDLAATYYRKSLEFEPQNPAVKEKLKSLSE